MRKGIIWLLLICTMIVAGDLSVYRQTKSSFAADLSDQTIESIVAKSLNIDLRSDEYLLTDIHVYDGYYVAMLFSSTTYESWSYRVDHVRGDEYRVISNYEGDEATRDHCAECPSDTARILLTACFSNPGHVSRVEVKKAADALIAAGVRGVVHLAGQQEATPQAVLNWLSCKNVKYWGRIGHGMRTSISFSGTRGGSIRNTQFGQGDYSKKIFIINSCFVHNSQFTPYAIGNNQGQANGYIWAGGDNVVLGMYESEYAFREITTQGILNPEKDFVQLTKEQSKKHCSASRQYGVTPNASAPDGKVFWKDVISTLSLVSPNGSGAPLLTGKEVKIEWSTNTTGTATIDLVENGQVVENIASNVANSGMYTWKIPHSIAEGTNYKVRITAGGLTDESDSAFEIKAGVGILNNVVSVNKLGMGFDGSHIVYAVPVNNNGVFVEMNIYNLSGKRVKNLVQSKHATGKYTLSVNNMNLTPGHYVCHMKAGKHLQSINITVK